MKRYIYAIIVICSVSQIFGLLIEEDIVENIQEANIQAEDEEILQYSLVSAIDSGVGAEEIERLLRSGADVNFRFSDGGVSNMTPLHLASKLGRFSVCESLIRAGADSYAVDGKNWTPHHYAADEGDDEVCRLLSNSQKPNFCGALRKMSWDLFRRSFRNIFKYSSRKQLAEGGMTPLHLACIKGHYITCIELGENSPFLANNQGSTPLDSAIESGSLEGVKYLLKKKGAHIITHHSWRKALGSQNLEICKLVFLRGRNLNTAEGIQGTGQTALHRAAASGDIEFCTKLRKRCANLEATDNLGLTPLDWACKEGRLEVCKYLIEDETAHISSNTWKQALKSENLKICRLVLDNAEDLNVNEQNPDSGKTALHMATELNDVDFCVELLADGASLIVRDGSDSTPLDSACRKGYLEISKHLIVRARARISSHTWKQALKSHNLEVCRLVFNNGEDLDVNIQSQESGQTALHRAAESGDVSFCVDLLARGADANIEDSSKSTPLDYACRKGHLEICSNLINQYNARISPKTWVEALESPSFEVCKLIFDTGKNLDVNMQSQSDGQTALHRAAASGDIDFCKKLLGCGGFLGTSANPTAIDSKNQTPFDYACENGHLEICELLLKKNKSLVTSSGWRSALELPNIEICKLLFKFGKNLDVNIQSQNSGRTALHRAAISGDIEFCKKLHIRGANLELRDISGLIPLDYSCKNDHLEVYRYLIKEIVGRSKSTPLDYACEKGFLEVCRYLIEKEKEPISSDTWKLALESPNLEVCRLVFTKGENLNINEQNRNNGQTALHRAAESGDVNFCSDLLASSVDAGIKDFTRFTALHTAIVKFRPEICKILANSNPSLIDVEDVKDEDVEDEDEDVEDDDYLPPINLLDSILNQPDELTIEEKQIFEEIKTTFESHHCSIELHYVQAVNHTDCCQQQICNTCWQQCIQQNSSCPFCRTRI